MTVLTLLLGALSLSAQALASSVPTAKVRNGTYEGLHLPQWNQDAFLGIPFAQPPVGNLRWRWPQSLNTSFHEVRKAVTYGHTCIQHPETLGDYDEDCLVLNVVRPSSFKGKLPVLIWIYGGGLARGSSADPKFNFSGLVQTAHDAGQPIIGVSINYRLDLWGFLQSPQILAEGSSNAGLLDQRMAFRWIQENIGAFGGDTSRVTVWGESAGAQSIGLHLVSYGGRNDRLFSGAIMESGGPAGTSLNALPFYNSPFENLTRTVGCLNAVDRLACLRGVPASVLFAASTTVTWNPIVDGDFLTDYPSNSVANSKFIKVPIITGANSDEGTTFSITGPNTPTELFDALLLWRDYNLSPPTIRRLFELYPDDHTTPKPPYAVPPSVSFSQNGAQWRRSAAIGGDLVMIAQRRKVAEAYTAAGMPVYSYRFDTPVFNADITAGANHGCNVVFSFQNITGALGPVPPFASYKTLSLEVGRAYANFAATRNPNPSSRPKPGSKSALPQWPKYDLHRPTNMVFNSNGSFVENDTFRKAGIAFINRVNVWREILT